jgi:hypothetical protein
MSTVHRVARAHCFDNGLNRCAVCRVALRRLPVEWIGRNKCRGGTSSVRRVVRWHVLSAINAETVGPRALTSRSTRRPTSRTISHMAVLDPRPSGGGGGEELRIEPGHVSTLDPCLGYDTFFPETLLWVVRSSLGGVRTPSNGFGLLYLRGLGCAHRDPKPTGSEGVVSESATLTAHEIPLGLFSVRLRVAAQASCLHTTVRGTPNPGYRQWPPGPPQGRMRACRRGQSLADDRVAAPERPLMQLLPARLWSRRLPRLPPRLTGP